MKVEQFDYTLKHGPNGLRNPPDGRGRAVLLPRTGRDRPDRLVGALVRRLSELRRDTAYSPRPRNELDAFSALSDETALKTLAKLGTLILAEGGDVRWCGPCPAKKRLPVV